MMWNFLFSYITAVHSKRINVAVYHWYSQPFHSLTQPVHNNAKPTESINVSFFFLVVVGVGHLLLIQYYGYDLIIFWGVVVGAGHLLLIKFYGSDHFPTMAFEVNNSVIRNVTYQS